MNENTRGFCVSCGVARNYGDTCDYCGRLYVETVDAPLKTKRVTALPAKYRITKSKQSTAVTWRWSGRGGWVLIGFAAIWIGMTYPIAADYFQSPVDAIPVQLLPVSVGIILLCHAIMKLVNKTSIFASKQSLYIRHHPIPWRGKFKIATGNIEQVYVSRIQRSNEKNRWHAPALQLISKDGQRHELLRGRTEAEFTDFESLRLIILKALNIEPENITTAHDNFS